MDKKEILDILDNAKDERGAVPMRLVRQAFDKLVQPEERTEKRTKTHACDCISQQDAVELAMKYCPDDDGAVQCDGDIREFLDELENLPPVQSEQPWIPCSERLPEEDHWLGGSGKQFSDNVLVSIYNSDDEDEWVDVSQTIDGEWRIGLPRHCKIVAWMPLPEPHKEGGADVR